MCHEPEPCAVYTGCAAGRYHRIFHLPQGHRQIRVPAGGGDVQPASGRRDQPYIPENTVRTARSDGRRKCDGGWHHKRSAEAVHRHGDTEPDRLIRNTDAAGIPAGSLYDLYFHGLPGYPKRNCHFKRPQKRQSGRSHFTGDPDERSADNAGRSRQNLYP